MGKRILSMSLMLIALSISVYAQKFTYNYRGVNFFCKASKSGVTITGFDMKADKVVVPSIVVNPKSGIKYEVTDLNLFAEATNYKASVVVIEKGITNIEEYCFNNFSNLQQVYIPLTIDKIGKKAFNAKHLPTFNMSSSIEVEDLRKGLAVFPHATAVDKDPLADLDLSNYKENDYSATVQEEVVNKEIIAGNSDIDYNIPVSKGNRENTFCIIIANEHYKKGDTGDVKYAAQDGQTFYEYCTKTLGIPKGQVKKAIDADYLTMKDMVRMLEKANTVLGNDANYIVYYSGHGIPDEKGNCKLMPVDVSINDVENGYSLKDIYDVLGGLTSKSALMIIDACFSGNDRNNMFALDDKHKGIVRNIKQDDVKGNVVVMTAASNTETALVYGEKGHGLFSYYIMKKLQETKGNVTYGELFDYVQKEVKKKSTLELDKLQTPCIKCSDNLMGSWKDIKF